MVNLKNLVLIFLLAVGLTACDRQADNERQRNPANFMRPGGDVIQGGQ